jgi:TonB family protein
MATSWQAAEARVKSNARDQLPADPPHVTIAGAMTHYCRQVGRLIVVLCLCFIAGAQEVIQVPASEAARHLVKRVPPEYPNLAAMAHIQGKVILEIKIAADGSATLLGAISGHPLLVQSAMDVVNRWKYEPFLLNGVAVPVKTHVYIFFALGPEAELQQRYYAQEIECRDLLRAKRFEEAGNSCDTALQSANEIKSDGFGAKVAAYGNAGQAAYQLNKFPEAVQDFQERLKLAKKSPYPDSSGWADAHHDLALALKASGQLAPAEAEYRETEKALDSETKSIKGSDRKELAARQHEQLLGQMSKTLTEHAALLREMGRNSEADDLEQRTKSLPASK